MEHWVFESTEGMGIEKSAEVASHGFLTSNKMNSKTASAIVGIEL